MSSQVKYSYTLQEDGPFWVITFPENPEWMTQAKNLSEVEAMARDYISLQRTSDGDEIVLINVGRVGLEPTTTGL